MEVNQIIKNYTGKDVIEMPALTTTWLQWYQGDVKDFHNYEDYNGEKKLTLHRRTLNMAKKVAEDWANLLLNEKTNIVIGNEEQQQAFWDLLSSVYFWQKGNEGVEKAFALGNGAFVEGFDENKKARLQFVNATKIKPLNIEQDRITECAFVNTNTDNTIIQIHIKGRTEKEKFVVDYNGTYHILTLIYRKNNVNSQDIGELVSKDNAWLDTKSDKPWFQMLKPNIANNEDVNSPMGISVYANALDTLQGVDLAYDGFCEEMRLGKAKIFINKKLTQYDENGEHLIFDVNQTGFYYLGETADKQPVTFYNPVLRTDGYFNGINNGLNLLSSKCGFGENHYRFNENGISTATQVISEQNEKFKTKRKHEIILYDVLVDMSRALMYISNEFTDNPVKFDLNANIEVKFDDSIIEDKATEMLNDRQDLASGVISRVEYRMKWYGEDEATAKRKIAEIDAEKRANMTNFFTEE